ncbi:hypothetical protein [Herbaspirillum sp. C7C8]|uniref:hypothetical protein n=1 Tax=Herbaspirillum sp. C7C8 TaxID=2736665 RepID=UPI001F519C34|nr:hypothetical protein [Herbaspirillum sp. C7C8]MCI1005234.1 hypothetical protein [Herbaspirillum sp. C7C8]
MSAAIILKHPSFNGPEVSNPVFRGKKKGCVSLGTVRRRKIAETTNQTRSQTLIAAAKNIGAFNQKLQKLKSLYEAASDVEWLELMIDVAIQGEIENRVKGGAK